MRSGVSLTPRMSTRLIAHEDAALEKHPHGLFGDPRDFFGALKCVCSTTSLPILRPRSTTRGQRVEPLGMRDDLHRHDRRAFGGEAHAAHVRNIEQRVADQLDVLRRQLIRVAAGDDDVFEFRALGDILNASCHCLGVLASETLSTFSVSGPIA